MDVEGSEVINNLPSPGRQSSRRRHCVPPGDGICISWIRRQKKKKEKEGETAGGAGSRSCITCFGVDGEVGLAVQDAVHHPGAVAVGGVVSVSGRHLCHVGSCGEEDSCHCSVGSFG